MAVPFSTSDRQRLIRVPVAIAVAIGTAVVTGVLVWWSVQAGPEPFREQTRFDIVPPPGDRILGMGIALSPDGETLVYVGRRGGVRQLFRRSMTEIEPVPISGTESSEDPFFSPDGRWVGFVADGALKKVALAGGAPEVICSFTTNIAGASWGSDDIIVFARDVGGLFQVSANRGNPTALTSPAAGTTHIHPAVLAGDAGVMFTVLPSGATEPRLLLNGTNAHVLPSNHLVFARGASFWGIPFDRGSLTTSGDPGSDNRWRRGRRPYHHAGGGE